MKIEIAALTAVAANHKVPVQQVVQVVEEALNTAYHNTPNADPSSNVQLDDDGQVWLVDENENYTEPTNFGRIAVNATRQAVISWVRDQERRAVVGPWARREGKIFTGKVTGFGKGGEVRLRVEDVNAVLPAGEQVPSETLNQGDEVAVYILAANADDNQRTKLTVSRRQPALVTALIAQHCPAISSGKIEILSVAREPGVRTKVAVKALLPGVDAVEEARGIGDHRIAAALTAISPEAIDVVDNSTDFASFVANALAPAKNVTAAAADDQGRQFVARVPVDQLAYATGPQGINMRLAQRLTGVKIQLTPVD